MDKKLKLGYVKGVNPDERSVTAYVSTYEWDRMGERFAKGAWELENFLKNPVVLLQHDNHSFPVGKAVSIQEDEIGLLAKTVFHQETEEAITTFNLFEKKFLHAFSVGFIPKDFVMETMPNQKDKGVAFTKAELYEYSPVSVPANPGATVNRETAEMVTKIFGDSMLKKIADDSFLVLPEMSGSVAEHPEDLDAALKNLHQMARMVVGKPLVDSQLSLLKSTMDVLHEAIAEAHGGLAPEDMARLKEAVLLYTDTLKALRPAAAEVLKPTISQIAKALTGRMG